MSKPENKRWLADKRRKIKERRQKRRIRAKRLKQEQQAKLDVKLAKQQKLAMVKEASSPSFVRAAWQASDMPNNNVQRSRHATVLTTGMRTFDRMSWSPPDGE